MPRPAPALIQTQQLLPTPLHLTSFHQIGSVLMCHNSESLTSFLPHLPLPHASAPLHRPQPTLDLAATASQLPLQDKHAHTQARPFDLPAPAR